MVADENFLTGWELLKSARAWDAHEGEPYVSMAKSYRALACELMGGGGEQPDGAPRRHQTPEGGRGRGQ